MRRLISFFILLSLKGISALFYRYKIGWPSNQIQWNNIKLIVFLNHTSLFEPIFLGFLPVSFLWQLSKKLAAPGADKTMNRPVVGTLYKLMSPGITSITRKRDDTWEQFKESISPDSIIMIAPEGRMMRKNGLDLEGNKMTVRGGVADLLAGLDKGQMIIAYSGGLHHVQIPGEGLPKVFKTLKLNMDAMQIADYKASFDELCGSPAWKKKVLDDLQYRLETKIPV
jgi:hypothetical protein